MALTQGRIAVTVTSKETFGGRETRIYGTFKFSSAYDSGGDMFLATDFGLEKIDSLYTFPAVGGTTNFLAVIGTSNSYLNLLTAANLNVDIWTSAGQTAVLTALDAAANANFETSAISFPVAVVAPDSRGGIVIGYTGITQISDGDQSTLGPFPFIAVGV